jgi:hypothetical protein
MWRMRKRKEKQQPENEQKFVTREQALHCISKVMRFAIDSNS